MTIKKTVLRAVDTIINWTLMTGVIASIGLLSFCGMWTIAPSIPLAITAFILAGFVEGEVFKRNIFAGMKDLRLLSSRGVDQLIIQSLDASLNPKTFIPEKASPFLLMYYQQKKFIAGFEDKQLTEVQQLEKKKALHRLKYMRHYFIEHITGNPKIDKTLAGDDFIALTKEIKTDLPAMKQKVNLLRFGFVISLISGVAFGFATASSLAVMGTALGLSLSTFVLPLSLIAAVGYVFLIFHTTKDMLFNETISKWRNRLTKWFKPREYTDQDANITKEGVWHYRLRTLGTGLLIALSASIAIAATLATAGTWWYAVRSGAELIPALARSAYQLTAVLVPISALATFAFSIRNSFQSIKYLVKQSKNIQPWDWIKRKIAQIFTASKGENAWQAINPFRILARVISLPYTLCVFIGHAISIGLTGDRTPGMEVPSLLAGTLNDSMTDMHYLFDDGHDHHAKPKLHKPDEDEHSHSTIPDYFLKVVLSPILLIAATWNYAFSQMNKSPLSFKSALEKSFGSHHHHPYQSKTHADELVSTTWKVTEVTERFKKEKARLKAATGSTEASNAKIAELTKAEDQIKACLIDGKIKPLEVNRKLLNTPRFFSAEQKTQSMRFMDKIERDFMTPSPG